MNYYLIATDDIGLSKYKVCSFTRQKIINKRYSEEQMREYYLERHKRRKKRRNGESKAIERRRALRMKVFERDGNACVFCGTTENLTMDHVIPKQLKGQYTFDNLQTLCFSCNQEKANKFPYNYQTEQRIKKVG